MPLSCGPTLSKQEMSDFVPKEGETQAVRCHHSAVEDERSGLERTFHALEFPSCTRIGSRAGVGARARGLPSVSCSTPEVNRQVIRSLLVTFQSPNIFLMRSDPGLTLYKGNASYPSLYGLAFRQVLIPSTIFPRFGVLGWSQGSCICRACRLLLSCTRPR